MGTCTVQLLGLLQSPPWNLPGHRRGQALPLSPRPPSLCLLVSVQQMPGHLHPPPSCWPVVHHPGLTLQCGCFPVPWSLCPEACGVVSVSPSGLGWASLRHPAAQPREEAGACGFGGFELHPLCLSFLHTCLAF